jgi:hypothetical protein
MRQRPICDTTTEPPRFRELHLTLNSKARRNLLHSLIHEDHGKTGLRPVASWPGKIILDDA